MKAFVITINDVIDFAEEPHTPEVYLDEAKAKKAFENLKEEMRPYCKANEQIFEDETWIEIYEDGRFAENHYCASLQGVDVIE